MARTLGAWNCSYCGNKRIWGNVFDCSGCGHPRPRGVRFYQVDNAPVVTPEIAAQLGSGGPNWYCEHCDSGNKDNTNDCWNCGAPRGSSPRHEVRKYLQGQSPSSEDEAVALDDDDKSWVSPRRGRARSQASSIASLPIAARHASRPVRSTIDNSNVVLVAVALFVGVVLLGLGAYRFFFDTRTEVVQVDGFNWEQSLSIQEFQSVRETSWSTHPLDAYNIVRDYRDTGRDQRIHDGWETVSYQDTCYQSVSYSDTCTRSVYVSRTCTGTRDNGDGSFSTYSYECGSSQTESYSCTKSRQEPYSCTKTRQEELYHYEDIYDNFYTYNVDRWVTVETFRTSGDDHSPYFYSDFVTENPYSGAGDPLLGQERSIEIPGTYSVTFYADSNSDIGDEGYFDRDYSLDEWRRFSLEEDYPIEVNFLNVILASPQP